jgi:hypothetical protein
MALYHSSNIVTRDLLFYYDSLNTAKSWKGAPTTNTIVSTPIALGIYAYVSGPVATANIPDSSGAARIVNTYTITSAVNTARARIATPITVGQTYTFSCKMRYNGSHLTGAPSFDVNATKGNPEASGNNTLSGVVFTATPIGNNWYYLKYTFTVSASPTGAAIVTYGINTGNNTAYISNTFDVYEEQFEVRNFATPYAAGVRSTTGAILDLTNLNTITATELTYQSNNTFRFDGSNDYLTISTFPTKPTVSITCEAWIYPTKPTITGVQRGGAVSATNTMYLGIIDSIDGGVTYALHWANQTSVNRVSSFVGNVPNNRWSHIVGTYNGATTKAYLNGVEVYSVAQTGTIPDATYVIGTYGSGLQDGVHNFNGEIPVARIYSRALSAIEVAQNFNAMRGRYGL